MDRNFKDRRKKGRSLSDRRNGRKNVRNDRRNHERNFETNRDNKEKRNMVSELWEELNEEFVKGLDVSKEKPDDDEIGRLKSVVEFDSTKLN